MATASAASDSPSKPNGSRPSSGEGLAWLRFCSRVHER
jgi:hypothetical protein